MDILNRLRDRLVALVRTLHPKFEPLRLGAAVSATYALVTAIIAFVQQDVSIQPETIYAAITAIGLLFGRRIVTPIANPKAKDGTSLIRTDSAHRQASEAADAAVERERERRKRAEEADAAVKRVAHKQGARRGAAKKTTAKKTTAKRATKKTAARKTSVRKTVARRTKR